MSTPLQWELYYKYCRRQRERDPEEWDKKMADMHMMLMHNTQLLLETTDEIRQMNEYLKVMNKL